MALTNGNIIHKGDYNCTDGGRVNCLAIGHKTGSILVTGCEDNNLYLWSIGKSNTVANISGHTGAVETLRFGNSEENLAAGLAYGGLKILDLQSNNIVRTLKGHKSSIKSLHFHPSGDFVASASTDTNIKLWDIRRKGCIFTYKGHSGCVNCVRFSPDGRWLASAGDDSVLKLWDLTAGKVLADLNHGQASRVICAEYHPCDLLLASSCADSTVTFWDLEKFQRISSTMYGDCAEISCLQFHPKEKCLYGSAKGAVKIYGWEPSCIHDSVDTTWGLTADMALVNNQLICASFADCSASMHSIDVQQLVPLAGSSRSSLIRPEEGDQYSVLAAKQDPSQNSAAELESKLNLAIASDQSKADASPASAASNQPKPDVFPVPNLTYVKANVKPALSEVSSKPQPQPQEAEESAETKEQNVFAAVVKGHDSMMAAFRSRTKNLQTVQMLWRDGNTKIAVESALRMNDNTVTIDLINILTRRPSVWNIDLCAILLPHLFNLLNSKYDVYVGYVCATLKLILKNFAGIIRANLTMPPDTRSVDIAREDRHVKCKTCNRILTEIKSVIGEKLKLPGCKHQSDFKELQQMLSSLD